jgi:ring-1,2-phenylacetyl-CoA epoxidase subunit PaaE
MTFYSLTVKDVILETDDAVSILFFIPEDHKNSFLFFPGQYVTVSSEISGKEIRRPYSINTMPGLPYFGITVKRVHKGNMSHFLNRIQSGTVLNVSSPEGHFIVKPSHNLSRSFYFFAAGSGITPVMSMIRTILEEEPKSVCYLLYGNRHENSIIFRKELEDLEKKYSGQLFIEHILSNPLKSKASGLGGLLGKKETLWKGETGRIGEKSVEKFLQKFPSRFTEREYYTCGPGDMITKTEKYLLTKGIDSIHIHKEFFTSPGKENTSGKDSNVTGSSLVEVTLKGITHQFDIPKNKIILDELVEKKLDPPYSCTSGACSTCIAKVSSGDVKMDACYALEDDEVAAGYVLTCQARPVSDKVILTYDL